MPTTATGPHFYCHHCQTISPYEERDLFDGQLFCPVCTARTEPADRAKAAAPLQKLHPQATLWQEPVNGPFPRAALQDK